MSPVRLPIILASLFMGVYAQAALTLEEARQIAPLPDSSQHGGALFTDLNNDGHDDLIVSNPHSYGIYLFNPVEKKNVQWDRGWSHVLREGRAGDANSLPLLVDAQGQATGLHFSQGALRKADDTVAVSLEELLRVPGPAPLSPKESFQALRVKPGYQASLIAHEPLVQDPIFMDWDSQGRLWVVEMGDYPFAPGETTRDGRLGAPQTSPLQTGRIKILHDTNGDGLYDRATVFLDGLRHPTGLAFWKGGVFISAIPDILYAEDTDGDGICDRREPWFTGFTAGNPQHLVNGFCWGLDGWFYGANGDSGGDITVLKTGQKIPLGTSDFRFHPVTGEFQLEAGRSQYGRWRDDFGNWFGNNNTSSGWHYHLPLRYLEAHPKRVAGSLRGILNTDGKVFPISAPVRRFNWASATQTLTAACSPMPWFDGQHHTLLVCEPAHNLVHREVLDYTRFPLTTHRHLEDETAEFIASTDHWFRPSLVREGPDGALYLADMYRLVLEHPEWIPDGIARGLDLRAGEDRGRLYRIATPASASKLSTLPLPHASAMRSPHRWQRDTAQRLLLEKADPLAASWLRELAADSSASTAVRIQAAWTAHLISGEDKPALVALLHSGHPQVRGAALTSAGDFEIHPDELASWFPEKSAPVAAPALPVITHTSPDRIAVVEKYLAAIAPLEGDARRGELVYQKACMACHRLGSAGAEVGPDLATVAAKPVAQILEAIFDPNRAVEQRNVTTQITLKDGSILAGILSAETPSAITLRLPGGVDFPVPRADIRSLKTLPTSLMPEGLESVLTPQETADLIRRIQSS